MIIRSAILEGDVAPADRARFDAHMGETVVAAIATYPRIRAVELRRTVERDEGAPAIYMQFDLLFDSLEDMHFALASETRQAVRAEIAKAMGMFKGRVYHVVSSRPG
ncbi:MAG: EthD family reductase [Alphaproteobacteria bacterium]|nr:EthD family reductase [Alphaproteobacteria bacterium]